MNYNEIFQELEQIITSNDAVFADAARTIKDIAQQCQSGQMSADETQAVLADVQAQLEIINDMGQLSMKQTLHTVINGLIALAGAV